MLFASADPSPDGKKQLQPFEHVQDAFNLHTFEAFPHIDLPPGTSKFLIFLTLSAVLTAALVLWVANKIKSGDTPKGKLWNFVESLLFFVRDKVARPSLGEKDGDKYMPFLSTLFLFIFFCNLFGMLPFLPSPTAHIYVTGALALISFVVIHYSGLKENGVGGYLKTFIPHIHLEGGPAMKFLGVFLTIGIAGLEYITAFIRAIVLAVRLFANMLAGHTALFVILFFIKLVADPAYQIELSKGQDWMYWVVAPMSVLLVVALSCLELFIAGLQAFIFVFLTAIFIGLAKHPQH
jgi:F-type H+-transporting ATPase subunit a